MKKTLIALVLAITAVLFTVSCSSNTKNEQSENDNSDVVQDNTDVVPEEEEIIQNLSIYAVTDFEFDEQAFANALQNTYISDTAYEIDVKKVVFNMVEDSNGYKKVFNPQEQMDSVQSFNLELAAGDCIIYIMPENFFSPNLEHLLSLDSVIDTPENALENKGLKISDISSDCFGVFPNNYILCLADKEERYDEKYYSNHVELFKSIIE